MPWAEAKVGAVATQSFANVTYGPRGLKMLAEGKSADPHYGATIIDASLDELKQRELIPFMRLGAEAGAIMIGHGTYPQIDDPDMPASLSRRLTADLLRQIGFNGSSLISHPITTGISASSKLISPRRMRLLAWPRRPSSVISTKRGEGSSRRESCCFRFRWSRGVCLARQPQPARATRAPFFGVSPP